MSLCPDLRTVPTGTIDRTSGVPIPATSNPSERFPAPVLAPDVLRLRPDEAVELPLLETMRRPPRNPAYRERRREQLRRQTEPVQQQCRVELDVGLQVPAGLVLLEKPQRRPFHVQRKIVEFSVAVGRVQALRGACEHVGPRVAYAVDPVSEPHQPLPTPELLPQIRLGPT